MPSKRLNEKERDGEAGRRIERSDER